MSVIWKAKWGFLPTDVESSAYSFVSPTAQHTFLNVNHIDFSYMVEEDSGLFSIPTQIDVPLAPSGEKELYEGAAMMYDAMGTDFLHIYTCVGDDPISNYENNRIMIPSLYAQCPNLYRDAIGPNNRVRMPQYCYIPALNRVIFYYGPSSTDVACSLFDFKTGNRLVSTIYSFNSQSANNVKFPICFGYDGTEISLRNASNYIIVDAHWGIRNGVVVMYDRTSFQYGTFVASLFGDYSEPDYSPNPYEPGGDSESGGGGGTFDDESDPIPIPSLPTLSSADTGFTRIYNPSLSQLQSLAQYLWTDESIIQTIWNHIKQYFENPMDALISLSIVPVPVPNGGTETFKLLFIDTGVQLTVASNQFVDVDCGTLELKPYYGSALDYSPYTKVTCFLPFIGNVTLDVDEVMARTLQVKYRVDICSGACVAYILVDENAIYQYSGNCSIQIPLSSADFSQYVNAMIKVSTTALTAGLNQVAGNAGFGVLSEVAQQTGISTQTTKETTTARNPDTGRQITTGTVTRETVKENPSRYVSSRAAFSGLAPENIANTVGQVMSSKPAISHSGSFNGNSGYLGVRRPYLIIERPNMCMPSNYQTLNGFPCMITLELSKCSGFTRVQQVQLTGMGRATNPEQAEILQLLKVGVIF